MLINKAFDTLMIGKKMDSLLLGIRDLELGKRVLLLDPVSDFKHRGDAFPLDYYSYRVFDIWIKKIQAPCEIDLSNFSKSSNFFWGLDDVVLRLGKDPYQNYSEVCRKFMRWFKDTEIPCELSSEEFNFGFFPLYEKSCIEKTTDLEGEGEVKASIRKALDFLVDQFQHLLDRKPELIKGLYRLYQMLYKNSIEVQPEINMDMLRKLVYNLIAPHLNFQREGVEKALLEIYLQRGGCLEHSEVTAIVTQKKRPHIVELDGPDGIIRPKVIHYFLSTSDPEMIPYRIRSTFFKSMSYDVFLPGPMLKDYIGDFLAIYHQENLGTDHPNAFLSVESESQICMSFLYPVRHGSKESFFVDKVESLLWKHLFEYFPFLKGVNNILPIRRFSKVSPECEWKHDSFGSKKEMISGIEFYERGREGRKIPEFTYWGPLMRKSRPLEEQLPFAKALDR